MNLICKNCGKVDHPQPCSGQMIFYTKCEHCGMGYHHDIELCLTITDAQKRAMSSSRRASEDQLPPEPHTQPAASLGTHPGEP